MASQQQNQWDGKAAPLFATKLVLEQTVAVELGKRPGLQNSIASPSQVATLFEILWIDFVDGLLCLRASYEPY
jgi:hypothetical protein